MRYSASERAEIIRLVEQSHLPAKRTLDNLGIPRATFYRWYDRYREGGIEALADHRSRPDRVWNRIPDDVRGQIIDLALERPELSPRELAVRFTDEKKYFVSEASVYRLLKAHDLITSPAYVVIKAANEFKDKTTAINQLWQTDFTYLKITGWGWYFLSTVLDDFSRYIVAWRLGPTMCASDVTATLDQALAASGLDHITSELSARCTVRALAPIASDSAEVDHDSPSARKASTDACGLSTGGASTTTLRARRGASAKPSVVALTSARRLSLKRSRPISTRSRARCDSSACFARNTVATSALLGTSTGQTSPSARASVNNTGRVVNGTMVFPWRTTCRHASTTSAPEANRFSTSSSVRSRSSPCAIKRAAGVLMRRDVLSTSAISAGMRARRAARLASTSATRALFVSKRQIAIPAIASSWAALKAGGKGAASNSASACSASSRRPISKRRRTPRCRACAAFARSPCRSSAARAELSALAGQLKSRETSAISASATMHLARATASLGPKARAAFRNRAFARTRSPS